MMVKLAGEKPAGQGKACPRRFMGMVRARGRAAGCCGAPAALRLS